MQPYYVVAGVLARKPTRNIKKFCLDIVLPGMLNKMFIFYSVKIIINRIFNTFITILSNDLDVIALSLV